MQSFVSKIQIVEDHNLLDGETKFHFTRNHLVRYHLLTVRRSDNERGKWKRAALISLPCCTMNEFFIIPVPWFAEYRVNVTTDLWVKNDNGRPAKKQRRGTVHAMRACNYRSVVRFFRAVPVDRVRQPSIAEASATVGKSDKQPGGRYRPRARIVQEEARRCVSLGLPCAPRV